MGTVIVSSSLLSLFIRIHGHVKLFLRVDKTRKIDEEIPFTNEPDSKDIEISSPFSKATDIDSLSSPTSKDATIEDEISPRCSTKKLYFPISIGTLDDNAQV